MKPESTRCAECGTDYYPDTPAARGETCGAAGYVVRTDGARICYSCAHAEELRHIDEMCRAPKRDSRIIGYLDADSGRVTVANWVGRALPLSGRVTGVSRLRPGAPGSWISDRRVSVRLRGPHGTEWIGRGYGKGCSIVLRPTAATVRTAERAS
jgi:hypothetical protein